MGVKRREACRNTSFFEFSLCLSRACLGQNIAFIHKWLKKTVFSPLSRALKSNAVAPARAANVPAENAHLFLRFSYVRPEPVLANGHLEYKMAQKICFFRTEPVANVHKPGGGLASSRCRERAATHKARDASATFKLNAVKRRPFLEVFT